MAFCNPVVLGSSDQIFIDTFKTGDEGFHSFLFYDGIPIGNFRPDIIIQNF